MGPNVDACEWGCPLAHPNAMSLHLIRIQKCQQLNPTIYGVKVSHYFRWHKQVFNFWLLLFPLTMKSLLLLLFSECSDSGFSETIWCRHRAISVKYTTFYVHAKLGGDIRDWLFGYIGNSLHKIICFLLCLSFFYFRSFLSLFISEILLLLYYYLEIIVTWMLRSETNCP